jgi:hypothetical protein
MPNRSRFWFRWLQAACIAVQAFGAFMVVSPDAARAFFGTLLLGDPSAIGSSRAYVAAYIDLLHVVLGAVLVGWGVALFLVVRFFYRAQPVIVCRIVAISILCWAVPDTAYSLWSGFWQNAVLNAVFIAAFVPPLVAHARMAIAPEDSLPR